MLNEETLKEKSNMLFNAIRGGNNQKVIDLLKDGEPKLLLELKNERGETPLMVAIQYRKLAIMKIILEYKPDLTQKNGRGRDAAGYASACNDPELKIKMFSLLHGKLDDSLKELNKTDQFTNQAVAFSYEKVVLADERALLADQKREAEAKEKELVDREIKVREKERIITINTKGFRYLIEENLRSYFYVCKALEEERVQRKLDSIDNVISGIKDFSPVIQQQLSSSISGALIAAGVNITGTLLQLIRNNRMKDQAIRLTHALGTDFGMINEGKIKRISTFLSERYHDQIQKLNISTKNGNNTEPDPRPGDDLVILTKHIVARIVCHIMKNKNEFSPMAFFAFNEPKNIMLLEKRCIKAIEEEYNCAVEQRDRLLNAEETFFEGKKDWCVAGVLDHAGIKVDLGTELKFYIYSNALNPLYKTWHEEYGFCLGTIEEVKDRNFTLLRSTMKEKEQRIEVREEQNQMSIDQVSDVKAPLIENRKEVSKRLPCCRCM